VPDVARGDRRAALDAVSYRTLLDQTLLERMVPQRKVMEWMVMEWMAAPEPQHQILLAPCSARQSPLRRLVQEGKARLDARSFFHSCLLSGF
jgi:hypothetical protein